ncbi:MAG: stage III sporulation protein AA [Clostridia bacterium]|nr:stage III sporulation protein AA [Clostridia bacterium]
MSKLQINIEPVLRILPQKISLAVAKYDVEEIRLIANKPVTVFMEGSSYYISAVGDITQSAGSGITITSSGINDVYKAACGGSVYAVEEELRHGFVTIEGGHRIGICGTAVVKSGEITYIKHISALNIRVAKQAIGSSKEIIPMIYDKFARNTLIVSPPGCGKTTLLRDIARVLGSRYKIGIADERSEIAASYMGVPQTDVGEKTVVMDLCPKAQAINMLVRTMGVEMIITDEIGTMEDVRAIKNAFGSGIKVIASAHGYCPGDITGHPNLRELTERGFERIITLSRRFGVGTVEEVTHFDN